MAALLGTAACGSAQPPETAQPHEDARRGDGSPMPAPEPEYLSNDAPKDGADQKTSAAEGGAPATLWRETGVEDPSGHALEAFHAALARAARGEGKARVLFYGASHVAGDTVTARVREHLTARFGDGGPGLVMPAHPWKYYRPKAVGLESSGRRWKAGFVSAKDPVLDFYGPAGVFVETRREGAYGAFVLGEKRRRPHHLRVHYLAQPGGGDVRVIIGDAAPVTLRTRAKSKHEAHADFDVPEGTARVELRTASSGPVRLFAARLEAGAPGVVVSALGVNGARAKNQLHWEDAPLREFLREEDPALVVLAYGTNESGDDDVPIASYEAEVRRVVSRVREAAPAASCLLIGPTDRPLRAEDGTWTDRPRTADIVASQRRVAGDLGCGFFDLVAFMGGPLSMPSWVLADPPLAANDHVHLTSRGYALLGDVLTRALLAGYRGADGAVAPN